MFFHLIVLYTHSISMTADAFLLKPIKIPLTEYFFFLK